MPNLATRQETEFEKPRGVFAIDILDDYAQVHVSQLPEPVHANRLRILQIVKVTESTISLLKLTPSGVSFLIDTPRIGPLESALQETGFKFSIKQDRSLIEVKAVNMRDGEGLIARLAASAIATGARIQHFGDQHDTMILATETADAPRIAEAIRQEFLES